MVTPDFPVGHSFPLSPPRWFLLWEGSKLPRLFDRHGKAFESAGNILFQLGCPLDDVDFYAGRPIAEPLGHTHHALHGHRCAVLSESFRLNAQIDMLAAHIGIAADDAGQRDIAGLAGTDPKFDPFADAVLAGWTRGAMALAPRDPESGSWLGPLWGFWLAALKRSRKPQQFLLIHGHLEGLLGAMPASQAEDTLAGLVRERFLDDDVPVERLLAAVPVPWGESLALAYLEAVEALAGYWHLPSRLACRIDSLPLAAQALPPALLGRAAELAGFAPGSLALKFNLPHAWALDEFSAVVSLRMRFYAQLEQPGRAAAAASPSSCR